MGGRAILAAAVGLLCVVLGLYLLLGMVEGLDRETGRGIVSTGAMLLYEAVGLATLAAVVFTITRAVRVSRGEPAATMVIALVGSLIGFVLFLGLLVVTRSD